MTGDVNAIVTKVIRIRQSRGFQADRGAIYNEVLSTIQKKNIKVSKNKQKVSFKEALQAGKASLKIITGQIVSQKEIGRRWEICDKCPAKTETKECFSCNRAKFLAQITHEIKGIFGTEVKFPGESKKFSCGVCGCSLAMLLPTKTSDLHEDTPQQKELRPDFCWMSKGSPNYIQS